MSRFIELMQKNNRTESEELEYIYLDKAETLQGLVRMARQMGNKNPYENFLVQDAFKRYEQAKNAYLEYQKAQN